MANVFDKKDSEVLIARINKLKATTKAIWGKMTVDKMLAHCNVTYEMVYTTVHKKPNIIKRMILKIFIKNKVVSSIPYKKYGSTARQFIIKKDRDFDKERKRLIEYIERTQALGSDHFDGKESLSFGKLNAREWNNLFYKHIDHHLIQFGV